GEHFIRSPRFSLSMRPWSKLAHAGSGEFEYRVELELRGIPAQAWHLSTADTFYGGVVGSSASTPTLVPATTSPRSASPTAHMTPRASAAMPFWRLSSRFPPA
uniref:Uncharacterized protein n=1 Tax=Aegilops tauschii subsp. strangulata TaxID=200361 RepID=A0A453EH31_AEGTS